MKGRRHRDADRQGGSGKQGRDAPAPGRGSVPGAASLKPRLRWILLAAVVALSSLLVAGAFIAAPHTGGDNAAYLTLAYSLITEGSYTELFDPASPPHTRYPPVFPVLLAGLMLAGARTWSAFKAVAVVSTVAASALTYLWAERRIGPLWAAGVALLVAASSAMVYHSHWILSDPTFVALTLLALWALDRADRPGGDGASERGGGGAAWLALGVAGAGLAYFTRSAGIPLVAALWGWLVLRRRWRALAASVVTLAIPMVLWMVRARGGGDGDYLSDFWRVNPYQPELGQVGVLGLVPRVWENLLGYVGNHIPSGIVGSPGVAVAVLGWALTLAAVLGWVMELRRRPGPAELFTPMYLGLILVWPPVWSGDRFALPLYPILFFYAALALRTGAARLGRAGPSAVGAAAFLVVALPAMGGWGASVKYARACTAAVEQGGPFACYHQGVGAFVKAAAWAGANLPEGSAVLSRKPRMFFVLGGVPSRTFPFTDDPASHLAMADKTGARYLLLDEWDGQAARYVAGAVAKDPGAFCAMRGFGSGTQLLGILPPEQRGEGLPQDDEAGIRIPACPPSYLSGDGTSPYPVSSRVPLLDRL